MTLSILWGLALSTRLIRRKGVPAWLLDLHKFLGTLSIVFVGVHLLALWADNFVYFGPGELFVPFASPWRPGAVAWGIAATYLLVAIQLTSWMMKRLPRKLWHSVHLTEHPDVRVVDRARLHRRAPTTRTSRCSGSRSPASCSCSSWWRSAYSRRAVRAVPVALSARNL